VLHFCLVRRLILPAPLAVTFTVWNSRRIARNLLQLGIQVDRVKVERLGWLHVSRGNCAARSRTISMYLLPSRTDLQERSSASRSSERLTCGSQWSANGRETNLRPVIRLFLRQRPSPLVSSMPGGVVVQATASYPNVPRSASSQPGEWNTEAQGCLSTNYTPRGSASGSIL
jgi:hypothetical protein